MSDDIFDDLLGDSEKEERDKKIAYLLSQLDDVEDKPETPTPVQAQVEPEPVAIKSIDVEEVKTGRSVPKLPENFKRNSLIGLTLIALLTAGFFMSRNYFSRETDEVTTLAPTVIVRVTATHFPTVQPTPEPVIIVVTATPEPEPTATATPRNTSTPKVVRVTATPQPTKTARPTSTRRPTQTPRPLPTPTASRRPQATARPTSTSRPQATAIPESTITVRPPRRAAIENNFTAPYTVAERWETPHIWNDYVTITAPTSPVTVEYSFTMSKSDSVVWSAPLCSSSLDKIWAKQEKEARRFYLDGVEINSSYFYTHIVETVRGDFCKQWFTLISNLENVDQIELMMVYNYYEDIYEDGFVYEKGEYRHIFYIYVK